MSHVFLDFEGSGIYNTTSFLSIIRLFQEGKGTNYRIFAIPYKPGSYDKKVFNI
jgi:hypothetical protein